MKITAICVDLAKSVIQIHRVDSQGNTVPRKQLKRSQVMEFRKAGSMPDRDGSLQWDPHWARKLQQLGNCVNLTAPHFVKPYVKTNKNDMADAEAICEAVNRMNMRFVPVKNVEQQPVLSVHRVRQGFVKAKTALANQIRGLLAEYGVAISVGTSHITKDVPRIVEDGGYDPPGSFQQRIMRLVGHFNELDQQLDEFEAAIKQ